MPDSPAALDLRIELERETEPVPSSATSSNGAQDLANRRDGEPALPDGGGVWPFGAQARARSQARQAATAARLDLFQDDLRARRSSNDVFNRAGILRAVEAAETAVFEIRSRGETTRLAILNRAQLGMTELFLQQIEALDGMRGRTTPEMLDALKERALQEYTERMHRASKADVEFNRAELLKLRP